MTKKEVHSTSVTLVIVSDLRRSNMLPKKVQYLPLFPTVTYVATVMTDPHIVCIDVG